MPSAIPHNFLTGTFCSTFLASHGGIIVKPFGFFNLAAYFAVVLSPQTPIEHNKPLETLATFCLTNSAIYDGAPNNR